MPERTPAPPGRRHDRYAGARVGFGRLLAAVLVLLSAGAALAPHRAAARTEDRTGRLPAAVTAAATAVVLQHAASSIGEGGTVAIAVADQLRPGSRPAGSEARPPREPGRPDVLGVAVDRPFGAASMVKLFVAEDVLHRARAGELGLTSEDGTLLRDMIRRSDDPAASALWVRFGGGRMVSDVADRYGLTGTAPPEAPGRWGDTPVTAGDVARFLALLPVVAHPEDAATILRWMREVTPRAADGFDQRYGLATLPGTPAVKQGWMCCPDGRRHVYSAGVADGRAVVLFGAFPPEVSYDAARSALTDVTALLPPARTASDDEETC